jgi:cholesterol transport system auxiliary component
MTGFHEEPEMGPFKRFRLQQADGVSSARTRTVMLAAILGVALLYGCGAARPSKYYQLTIPGDVTGTQQADSVPVTLLLGTWLTSHLYRDDRIVYSSAGEEMGTYEYQRWAEPPTEMLEEVLLRQLRASGRYRAVYSQRSNASGDFLLRGRLYDLKEISGRPMQAKVTFEVELRDLKTGATVWTHFYNHDEPVSGKDVANIVAALDKNVQQGIKEVVAGLDQYFASHPVK